MPAQVSYHRRCICCYHWFSGREQIEKYRADYEENTKRLNELNSNPDAIEQVAREKYLMKKPNEDIYVFEDNK